MPRHMSDWVMKNAVSADYVGRKDDQEGNVARAKCPRCQQWNTTEHKFRRCGEVQTAWRLLLGMWERVTGEALSAEDEWITAWGARWARWADEGDALRYGGQGQEEVFRVLHAAMVMAIERAAGKRLAPRKGHHIYNDALVIVQQMAQARLQHNRRAFMERWVKPGYAVVGAGRGCETVRIRMGEHTCRRVRAAADTGAPPPDTAMHAAIYTDGSATRKGAGWGMVAVAPPAGVVGPKISDDWEVLSEQHGCVVTDRKHAAWVGADAGTNNTGELMGVMRALRWAARPEWKDKDVVICYDSKYAAQQARGVWKAKKNVELIKRVQNALRDAEDGGVRIWWQWVKGHSGQKWNERADRLADLGASIRDGQGGHGKGQVHERLPPAVGEAKQPQVHDGVGVRWVTYQFTHTRRVMWSQTRWGVLDGVASKQVWTREEVQRSGARVLRLVRDEHARGVTTGGEAEEACAKVRQAVRELAETRVQRLEYRAWTQPAVTREIDCDINTAELHALLAEKGDTRLHSGASTWDEAVEAVLARAKVSDGVARVRLRYGYSTLGRALAEAGHVTGSREYAIGADPFKWPTELRDAAFAGMGAEMDDKAAYPRIIAAMTGGLGQASAAFLANREDVMNTFSTYLFAETRSREQRRKWMKVITNGYDMDSGVDAWQNMARLGGNPRRRSLRRKWMTLPNGLRYSLEEYRNEQIQGTRWMSSRASATLEFVRRMRAPGSAQYAKAEKTVKSYLLQEAEAASREAKMAWCVRHGVRVMSQQHDGVLCAPAEGRTWEELARELTAASREWCGFEVDVEAKQIVDRGRAAELAEWLSLVEAAEGTAEQVD